MSLSPGTRCILWALALSASVFAAAQVRAGWTTRSSVDLDVSVPPGLPLDWVDALPSRTVHAEPAVPTTGAPAAPTDDYRPKSRTPTPQPPSAIGLVRILTWDVTNHMAWTRPSGTGAPPSATQAPNRGELPRPSESLFWMSMSGLLRLLLHPAQTSEPESLAYLVTIGQGALPAARAARAEPVLRERAEWLTEQIGLDPNRQPVSFRGRTPYEAMMYRFTADELLANHPYDPYLLFGRRVLLLGTDATPFVAMHAFSDHSTLRQNAITLTSRLGTPGAADVLLRVVNDSDDPVARMRAIRGLGASGARRAVGTLAETLDAHPHVVEACALVDALGRIGDADAGPALWRFVSDDRSNPQALLTALTALARIPLSPEVRGSVVPWLRDVLNESENAPLSFQLRAPMRADAPDPPETRARIVAQLATLALVTQSALPARVALAFLDQPPLVAATVRARQPTSEHFGSVHPTVQPLFLERLGAWASAPASEALGRIVSDQDGDPLLRCAALGHLPSRARFERAIALSRNEDVDDTLRWFAFDLLEAAGHPATADLARALIQQPIPGSPHQLGPLEQHAYVLALRSLGRRGALADSWLIRFVGRIDGPAVASDDVRDQLHERVTDLVSHARRNVDEKVQTEIRDLLRWVNAQGVRSPVTLSSLVACQLEVSQRLSQLHTKRRSHAWIRNFRDQLVEWLLSDTPPPTAPVRGGAGFQATPDVPLLDTLLLELGRTRTERAVTTLSEQLKHRDARRRAAACLGLGATGRPTALPPLLDALTSADRFVRLCAYLALRTHTGEDFLVGDVYSSHPDSKKTAKRYRDHLQNEADDD